MLASSRDPATNGEIGVDPATRSVYTRCVALSRARCCGSFTGKSQKMSPVTVFLAALVLVSAVAVAEPAESQAVANSPAQSATEPIPLCRAPAPEALAEIAAKDDLAAFKQACDGLANAATRSLHMENTVIWMGLWQAGNPGGRASYTNRLDVAELKRRVATLTAELEAHIEQIQVMIRRQGELAR